MNCDENNFLQEDLVLDDFSAKSKPDDDSKSKEKEINSRSEFDDLQGQVKSVSDALNNFGEIFKLCSAQ